MAVKNHYTVYNYNLYTIAPAGNANVQIISHVLHQNCRIPFGRTGSSPARFKRTRQQRSLRKTVVRLTWNRIHLSIVAYRLSCKMIHLKMLLLMPFNYMILFQRSQFTVTPHTISHVTRPSMPEVTAGQSYVMRFLGLIQNSGPLCLSINFCPMLC